MYLTQKKRESKEDNFDIVLTALLVLSMLLVVFAYGYGLILFGVFVASFFSFCLAMVPKAGEETGKNIRRRTGQLVTGIALFSLAAYVLLGREMIIFPVSMSFLVGAGGLLFFAFDLPHRFFEKHRWVKWGGPCLVFILLTWKGFYYDAQFQKACEKQVKIVVVDRPVFDDFRRMLEGNNGSFEIANGSGPFKSAINNAGFHYVVPHVGYIPGGQFEKSKFLILLSYDVPQDGRPLDPSGKYEYIGVFDTSSQKIVYIQQNRITPGGWPGPVPVRYSCLSEKKGAFRNNNDFVDFGPRMFQKGDENAVR